MKKEKKEKVKKTLVSKVAMVSLSETEPAKTVHSYDKKKNLKKINKKVNDLSSNVKGKDGETLIVPKEKKSLNISAKATSAKIKSEEVVSKTEKVVKQVVKKIKEEVGSILTTKNKKPLKQSNNSSIKKGKAKEPKDVEKEPEVPETEATYLLDILPETFTSSDTKKNLLPDLSNINYSHLKKSDRPEPLKIEGEPTILVKTEVKRADPVKAKIKNQIFERCIEIQSNSVAIAKKAMNEAQESANEEKGSMEEKFDSFRESMHIVRDLYARQYQEGVNSLGILKRINPNLEHNTVILGSLVYTDLQNYFVSVSLGEIIIDKDKFITISTMTPLFLALSGKTKGDKFKFRDKTYTIREVF